MQPFRQILVAGLLGLVLSSGYAHEDHLAQLDADLEIIRNTEDRETRRQMLIRHLQTLNELSRQIRSPMQHVLSSGDGESMQDPADGSTKNGAGKGPLGLGQSIDNSNLGTGVQAVDIMEQQLHMAMMLKHLLITQEMILGLIDVR